MWHERRRNTQAALSQAENDIPAAPDCDPEYGVLRNEMVRQLNEELRRLPASQRLIFVMRSVECLSTEQTAQILDLPPATVRTRLHRARRRIARSLGLIDAEAAVRVYPFGAERCDALVAWVLNRVHPAVATV